MTRLTSALMRDITTDWQKHFPSLGVLRPMWLARRVGPIVQGVLLERSTGSVDYLPLTHVHSLLISREDLSLALHQPLRSIPHGVPERILVQFHHNHIEEAPLRLRHGCILPLDGPFSIDDIVSAFDSYREGELGTWTRAYWSDIISLLSWGGRRETAKSRIEQAIQLEEGRTAASRAPDWNRFREWSRELRNLDLDPERLDAVIASEVVRHKLDRLPQCELIK